jgi:predicted ABC-type ATPase
MSGLVKVQPIDFAVTRGPDVGYIEGATAGVDNARISRWTAEQRRQEEIEVPITGLMTQMADDGAVVSDDLQFQMDRGAFGSDQPAFIEMLVSEATGLGYEIPDSLSAENIQARREDIYARDGARMDRNNETLSRATPLGQAGAFVGAMASEFEDPVNLATIPLGVANTARLATTIAVEAVINATLEGLQTPTRNRNLVKLGQPEESILMNMAVGAVFGASIPLGIRGVQELGGLVSTSSRAIRSRVALLSSTSRSPAAQAAGNAMTRDIQQEADAVTVETPEAVREYRTRTDEAQVAASEGRAPDMPERPLAAFAPIDNDGSQLVDPRGLLVQPEVFQFKSEIVAEGGVTPKLQGVTEWVPHRAGVTLVYEYADGSQAVADGHQRTALARRIMAQDPTQNIRLRAQVFREEDGFSVEDVRVLAALKNIGEAADGMTASMAGDAAKVLRLRPEAIADLPRGPGIGRAQNLAKLSDDAFDLFINRVIEQRFAEQIGNMVSDPSMHLPIARLIERVRPETTEQAANIISQAMEAPTSRETTSDLFGETEVVESLYLEQAKVLERAMQIMRTDRSVFKTLTDQSERIEGTGQNRLDKTTNADARGQIEVALGAIKQLAHRAGPISEALRDGAQTYRTDGRLKDAAEKLAAVVRREVERNGLAGVSDGGSRRAPQSSRAEQAAPDPNEGFSDPVGEAAQAQVLQTRIEPRQAPEAGGIDELKALVAAGADRATIDSHPALQDAVARLSAIPETDKLPGYGTDEYEASRPFVFDGESVISVDEALPRWIEGAKRLASDETGSIYNGVSNDRTATIILGPPAAGKSSIANEIAVAQRAAIIDADEIKKTIPEFDGGIGASAVHEESSAYTDALEESLRAEGANVVYPKVGAGAASIERIIAKFKAAGYTVNLVNMAVTPENAYTRMIGRFVATGRIINPKYVDAVGSLPSATFTEIKTKGGADGYAQIDNNGKRFDPQTVSETDGGNALAGTRFADDGVGRQGPDAGNSENAGRDQQAEETSAGTQSLIDGVAPITARDRMEAAQAAPITGRPAGSDTQIGGLFDPGDPARSDLFDQVPVGRGFDNDGNEIALTMTRSDLAAELDADDEFIEQIGVCLK